jgi:hypothetical protein
LGVLSKVISPITHAQRDFPQGVRRALKVRIEKVSIEPVSVTLLI